MEKQAITFLRRKRYKKVKKLGQGAFGIVFSAESPDLTPVAVKVIDEDYSSEIEERVWPNLDHENVLPLLKVFTRPRLQQKMFVTPLHLDSLFRVVEKDDFLDDTEGWQRIRKWFREILSGLEYLHSSGYVHLDVKSDNILISSADAAILCDFTTLDYADRKIRRMTAPNEFCPPEYWKIATRRKGIEGIPYDIWNMGLLALGAITSHWPQKNLFVGTKWTWDAHFWPRLERIFGEPTFSSLVTTALPNVVLTQEELIRAKEFIRFLMTLDPEQRPSAEMAGRHPFLLSTSSGDSPVSIASHSSSDDLESEDDTRPTTSKPRDRRAEKRPVSTDSSEGEEGEGAKKK